MNLNLSPEAKAAIDLAKRVVNEGGELDSQVLIPALYFAGNVREEVPELGSYLSPLEPMRDVPLASVKVAVGLGAAIRSLATGHEVTARALLAAIARSEDGRRFLQDLGVDEASLEVIVNRLCAGGPALEPVARHTAWHLSQQRRRAISALSSYGRMLTDGPLRSRNVHGMDAAIGSLVRTLSRSRSRNAMVLGFPGTGKTAIVHELCRRIVDGDDSIPGYLADLDVFELSPTFLRAGASVVGEYETRLKAIIEVLEAHPRIVVFVDEAHSLLQSAVHLQGPFSSANEALKAPLQSGRITMIGCTTFSEWRHFIEPDRALADRFTVIRVHPPSSDQTLQILRVRRGAMEKHFHPLTIPDEALQSAVRLAETYLPGRYEPRKSLQLLDEACAYCVTTRPPRHEVDEHALMAVLGDMAGHGLVRRYPLKESSVLEALQSRIIGQDEVIQRVARKVVAGFSEWAQDGPRAVLMFCGPTGVGKTQTAIELARIVGGEREALIRVDCNTLHGQSGDCGPALNVLLGAPPGYVGHVRGGGGTLSRIRDVPECVVLFDEIEKAHPCIAAILLQVIDDGRIEDTEGHLLDFRRAFVIFTTNVGCSHDVGGVGFQATQGGGCSDRASHVEESSVRRALEAAGFGTDFQGRIDEFLVFRALDRDACRIILGRQLARLRDRVDVRGMALEWEPDVLEHLLERWQPQFGVRHLTTILGNRVVEQLALADAQGELEGVDTIRIALDEEVVGMGLAAAFARRRRSGGALEVLIA